jgi:hypothetical protein
MGYLGNQITTVFPTSISVDTATISGNASVGGTLGVTGVSTLSDNIVFGASAKGVHLGVTAAASSNLLNDYEEGTWTPSLGGNTSYTSQDGLYRKVGSLVFILGYIDVNAIGTGSTQVISGLPFSSGSREYTIPLSKLANSTFNFYSAQLRTSGSTLYLSAQTALDGSTAVNQNYFQNSTEIQFSGSYITS